MPEKLNTYRITAPMGLGLQPGLEVCATAKQWARIEHFCSGGQKRAKLLSRVMFKRGETVTLWGEIPKTLVADGVEALDPLKWTQIRRQGIGEAMATPTDLGAAKKAEAAEAETAEAETAEAETAEAETAEAETAKTAD